jgi:peptidoglycan/LPS O-acetylase OafA/YrhL
MNQGTSTYLNLLRLMAAVTVVLFHSTSMWTPGQFTCFVSWGQQAVLVFFVLSGYVIAWVSDQKENNFITYASSRAARMYSVVVPALIITFVVDAIGRKLAPDFYYGANWGYSDKNEIRQFIRALFFVNEIWWSRSVPGSNNSYWSLGYEVPYYIVFAALLFAPRKLRLLIAALILCFFGPRVTALFFVWLMGVVAFRWGTCLRITSLWAAVIWLGTIVTFVVLRSLNIAVLFEQNRAYDFLLDYLIGACIATNIICAYHFFAIYGTHVSQKIHQIINWFAGATFTIYLLHFPLGQFLIAVYGKKIDDFVAASMFVTLLFIILFLIAQFTERKKEPWRRFFTFVFEKAQELPFLKSLT